MTFFDYLALFIVAASFTVGLWRGFFRELFSLLAWGASFWFSWTYHPAVIYYLAGYVPESFLVPVSVIILFFLLLAVFTLVARALELIVNLVGFSVLKRPLGAAFGVLRGIVMIYISMAILLVSPMKKEPWLVDSFSYYILSDSVCDCLESVLKMANK